MKNNLDIATIKFLYEKYKDYIVSVSIIFVCFILFLNVIIPQFQRFLDLREESEAEFKKLNILRENFNILSNLDESSVDINLGKASSALPNVKDFAGILNGVSIAAEKSNVFLGDFDFQVGDISKVSSGINNFPSLQLNLTLNSGVTDTMRFIKELYRTVPLSEVTEVQINGSRSQLSTVFYYKPFPPANISDTVPIIPFSAKGSQIIKDISSWNFPRSFIDLPSSPSSSESASESGNLAF